MTGHWHPDIQEAALRSLRKLSPALLQDVVLSTLPDPHAAPLDAGPLHTRAIAAAMEAVASMATRPSPALLSALVDRVWQLGNVHRAVTGRPPARTLAEWGAGEVGEVGELGEAGLGAWGTSGGGASAGDGDNATVVLGCHGACLGQCLGWGGGGVEVGPPDVLRHCRVLCHASCAALDAYEASVLEALEAHADVLSEQGEWCAFVCVCMRASVCACVCACERVYVLLVQCCSCRCCC